MRIGSRLKIIPHPPIFRYFKRAVSNQRVTVQPSSSWTIFGRGLVVNPIYFNLTEVNRHAIIGGVARFLR